jgi:hypothetical protein
MTEFRLTLLCLALLCLLLSLTQPAEFNHLLPHHSPREYWLKRIGLPFL